MFENNIPEIFYFINDRALNRLLNLFPKLQ